MPVRSLKQGTFFDPRVAAPNCLVPGSVPWLLGNQPGRATRQSHRLLEAIVHPSDEVWARARDRLGSRLTEVDLHSLDAIRGVVGWVRHDKQHQPEGIDFARDARLLNALTRTAGLIGIPLDRPHAYRLRFAQVMVSTLYDIPASEISFRVGCKGPKLVKLLKRKTSEAEVPLRTMQRFVAEELAEVDRGTVREVDGRPAC